MLLSIWNMHAARATVRCNCDCILSFTLNATEKETELNDGRKKIMERNTKKNHANWQWNRKLCRQMNEKTRRRKEKSSYKCTQNCGAYANGQFFAAATYTLIIRYLLFAITLFLIDHVVVFVTIKQAYQWINWKKKKWNEMIVRSTLMERGKLEMRFY